MTKGTNFGDSVISSLFSNVINMSGLFYGCENLLSISGLSNWNTFNVKDMSNLFYGCKSLTSISDISKWNTSNVINLG